MKTFLGRRPVALLVAGVLAASGAGLMPAHAADPPTIDRSADTSWGWEPQDCSTAAASQDLPVPVEGPSGVPHGAGSLKIPVGDDVYGEFGIPAVHSAADLTSYTLTMMSPSGELDLVAAIQEQGQISRFLTTTLMVPVNTWQVVDLTMVSWNHYPSNHVRFWGESPDDTGTLGHFVGGVSNVAFRPAVAVLGCNFDGGIGPRETYLDQSTIESTSSSESVLGTIDHEPPDPAPTPVVSTSDNVTITYGQRTPLSTSMTYGDSWPLVGQPWALERAVPDTDEWGAIAMDATSASGTAQWTVKPLVNTSYRWLHPEDGLGYFLEAVSDRMEVTVRSKVISKLVHSTVARGRNVKVRGSVRPRPPKGTSVTLWRWGTHHVRLQQTTVGRHGSFTFSTKTTKAGILPLRVTVKATPTNAAGKGRLMRAHVTR